MNNKQRKGISIRFKMFFELSAIILAAVIIILVINTSYMGDIYLYNEKQELIQTAEHIDTLDIRSGIYFGTVNTLESENNITIDIYDSDGTPLYLSTQNIAEISGNTKIIEQEHLSDDSVLEIYENNGKQYILLRKTLSFGGEVEIYSYKGNVDANASVALTLTWGSVILILFASLVLIYIYTSRFTKPLIKISEITEKMSNMDFSEKCESNSKDEIGILSDSINNLSTSLDSTLNDLNEKNRQLSDDIKNKQTLEQLRKEFISSISHELKTPIAIIKGYAEGAGLMLEAQDIDGAKEYCDIITKESERMNGLVFELLELSRYELGDSRLDVEQFELKAFIEDFTNSVKIVFEDKGISYSSNIEDIVCQGDIVKLTMVLNNYVSNAISHINGEMKLHIFTENNEDFVRVKVFNSGEHISDEDIEKIWKSFYRADKSRSRKEGRYGLGLSIVSAIQNLHEAKFGVENSDGGVIFWFDIKKA